MKLQSINLYPKFGVNNVQFSGKDGKFCSLAEIDREEIEVPESRNVLNKITHMGFKYQEIGNGIAECTAPYEKQWADEIISSVESIVEEDGFLTNSENDIRFLNEKYTVKGKDYVREYVPINNGAQERLGSGAGNFGPVYNYVVNVYDKTGEVLLRSAYYKREPKISKDTHMAKSVEYVLKKVKAYDRSELSRVITLDDEGCDMVKSIGFFRGDNKISGMLFENNKIVSFQDGNAYSDGKLLYNPTTFYFTNGALSSVEDKNVRYGFHTINKETYKYNDGEFTGFSDYKLSLMGGMETRKVFKMLDGMLVRTKKETKLSETY